jgi:tRNA pseudouridine38/39 synthase
MLIAQLLLIWFNSQLMLSTRYTQLLRMVKRSNSTSSVNLLVGQVSTPDYSKWSKEDLIAKINQLQPPQPPTANMTTTTTAITTSASTNENSTISSSISPQPIGKKKQKKAFDFSKHNTRFIAIKFGYLGWNYNGLAYQYEPTPLPTVEQVILEALAKAKLIASPDPECCKFSRCGRTDKGVSAMNQVISLNVRSSLSDEQQQQSQFDNEEIAYLTILNSMLPTDIRITAICLRPPKDFDARFSCLYRHYRYLFKKSNLDIELMQQAADKYKGVHDFRNFCKIDGSKQITNYFREVYRANIVPLDEEFYYLDLQGTAFLWHQVRCMMAILLLVGQKLELPTVVDDLLNVEKYPSKPNYEMANDIPLVLYNCVFPEMEWLKAQDFEFNKQQKDFALYRGMLLDYQVKSKMSEILDQFFTQGFVEPEASANGGGAVNTGNGRGRNYKTYVPISQRIMGDTFEAVNERHRQKLLRKKMEKNQTD